MGLDMLVYAGLLGTFRDDLQPLWKNSFIYYVRGDKGRTEKSSFNYGRLFADAWQEFNSRWECAPCTAVAPESGAPAEGTAMADSWVTEKKGLALLYGGYWRYPGAQSGARMHEIVHMAIKFAWGRGLEEYYPYKVISLTGSGDATIENQSLTNVAADIAGTLYGGPMGHVKFNTPNVVFPEEFLE
jgi:hypothetical protein